MTCLVGIIKNGQVVLASDSLTMYGDLKLVNAVNDYKIYQFPNFSVAVAGEGPTSEILELIEKEGIWHSSFIQTRMDCAELISTFQERFNDRVPEAENESLKYELLFGTKQGLFWCTSEPSMFEIGEYWAVGSGSSYALGALFALHPRIGMDMTLSQAANIAVLAACRFDQDCEPPVDVRIL